MSTANQFLDIAQDLIQTGGYNAFSYQDIARILGIKKASIHYHYPKKEDMGQGVVKRYTDAFRIMQSQLMADTKLGPWEKLDSYMAPFFQVSGQTTKVCLCGVLGGEFVSLPQTVQKEVTLFFEVHESLLSSILEEGLKSGHFQFKHKPLVLAQIMFSAMQGALLVARSKSDPNHFPTIANALKTMLHTGDATKPAPQ